MRFARQQNNFEKLKKTIGYINWDRWRHLLLMEPHCLCDDLSHFCKCPLELGVKPITFYSFGALQRCLLLDSSHSKLVLGATTKPKLGGHGGTMQKPPLIARY